MSFHPARLSLTVIACTLVGACGRIGFDEQDADGELINGSFEDDFIGWTHSGTVTIQLDGQLGYTATDGTRVLSFNDGDTPPDATLSQTLAMTPGASYELSFDLGLLAFNNMPQALRVELAGASIVLSEGFMLVRAGTNLRWDPRITRTFVADAASMTLTFYDTSTATLAVDVLLDDVRIMPGG